jgi:hypothetical protein
MLNMWFEGRGRGGLFSPRRPLLQSPQLERLRLMPCGIAVK